MVQIKADSKSHDVPCPWYKQRKLWCSLTMCAVACQQAVLHATRWAEDGPEQPTTLPFTASLGSSQRSSSSNLSSDDKKSTSVQASGGPSFGFYLFGDIPYAEWEEGMLRDQIAHLSKTRLNHTLFTVHVGDLQKTQRSLCKEDYYRMVQKVLRKGPLPTYVLAGDNDWYDCPKPKEALKFFGNHFFGFHKKWEQAADLDKLGIRQMNTIQHPAHHELFAFAHESILFVSVHLINGKEGDEPAGEWDHRMKTNIDWVNDNVDTFCSNGLIRGVILLGHSLRSPRTRPLFEGIYGVFQSSRERARMPVLYLHGDGHNWDVDVKLSTQLDWKYFRDVQVDQGAFADPILVEIASVAANGKVVPLKVEHESQTVFGRGLMRIDRQRGRYGIDVLRSFGYARTVDPWG